MKKSNQNQEIFTNEFFIKTLVGTQAALDGIVRDSERKSFLLEKLSDSILIIVENLKTIKEKVDHQDWKVSEIENQIKLISVLLDGVQERDVSIEGARIHLKELKYAVLEIKEKIGAYSAQVDDKLDKKLSFATFFLELYEGIKNVKAILLLIALILSIIAYFFGADFMQYIKAVKEGV